MSFSKYELHKAFQAEQILHNCWNLCHQTLAAVLITHAAHEKFSSHFIDRKHTIFFYVN